MKNALGDNAGESTLRARRMLCTVSACAIFATMAPAEETNPSKDDVVHLPRFEVREGGAKFTDFGMSVVTNFGVVFGGKIAWMRVGTVVPGSSAALLGLHPDDEIFAIDEVKLADLSRRQMLETFFHRKRGDRIKLLVRDHRTRHLRLVELSANDPRMGK